MSKIDKLSLEAITAVEDKIMRLAEPLTEFEVATLYILLKNSGMDIQRAYTIRVKAGAVD